MGAMNDMPGPALLPVRPAGIPAALKAHARWAPWRAVWNAKRGKWDKVPCSPSGYMLSTRRPEAWVAFDVALRAYQATPGRFAGVGYLMTGEHGLVGVDLDRCVDAQGQIAPWARELLEQLGGAAELSPSGLGLRAWVQGETAFDWCNHEQGIEVYAGHTPRFLTVTGCTVLGLRTMRPAPAGVLEQLAQRYAREREQATVISLAMPDLLDELALPDLSALEVPPRTRDFLADGTTGADRSRGLFTAAVDLFRAGLGTPEVLSVLASNPHAMSIALDHRRQDHDRALMYLWVEHTQKAQARAAASRLATADDFEDVRQEPGVAAGPAAGAAPRPRFAFDQAAAFTQRKPLSWLIKGVLPAADVGTIYGESGAGKSFLALDLSMAVARGEPWRGRAVRQGAVAYIVAEGAGGFTLRLRAFAEYHGADLGAVPLWVLGDQPNLLEKSDVKDLLAALRMIDGLVLVVLDTLAQTTPGGNENSAEDMGRALAHCRAIRKGTGAMVLLVAHAGKDASKGVRGWSGIKGAMDVEIVVERADKHRAATVSKMKDGTGEGDEFPFGLTSVTLGQDEDGEDVTSMVVTPSESAPGPRRAAQPKGAVQQLVLRIAQAMLDLGGELTVMDLVGAAVSEQLPPEQGRRDKRRENTLRAVENLAGAGFLSVAGGKVSLR